MVSPYTPTPTWSATVNEIDDSDAPTAANFNTSIEMLANMVAFLNANSAVQKTTTITASGNWTAPAGVTLVQFEGCGGGGGGAGGQQGNGTVNQGSAGGAGGAGARRNSVNYATTAGTVFAITIGTGGAGGAANTAGTDGGTTKITRSSGSVTVLLCVGAAGAPRGGQGTTSTSDYAYAPGGAGPARTARIDPAPILVTGSAAIPILPIDYNCGGASGVQPARRLGGQWHGRE